MAVIRQAVDDNSSSNTDSLKKIIGENNNNINRFSEEKQEILNDFINKYRDFYIWGVSEGINNNLNWKTVKSGDIVFFASSGEIKFIGEVEQPEEIRSNSPDDRGIISEYFWQEDTWKNIYLLKKIERVSFSVATFNKVANYKLNAQFRGLSFVKDTRVNNIEAEKEISKSFLLKFLIESLRMEKE